MRPSPAGTSITLPPDTGSRKEIEMKTRNRILHAALACALLSFAAAAAAREEPARQPAPQASATPDAEQQAMMAAWQKAATPGPQHAQTAEHFAGTWDTQQTMWIDPSAPPMVETGKSSTNGVLAGLQNRIQHHSRVPVQPFNGIRNRDERVVR